VLVRVRVLVLVLVLALLVRGPESIFVGAPTGPPRTFGLRRQHLSALLLRAPKSADVLYVCRKVDNLAELARQRRRHRLYIVLNLSVLTKC
jgi:hypothetical protein